MRVIQDFGNIFPLEAQCPVVDDLGDGRWRIYYGRRDLKNRSRIYYFDLHYGQMRVGYKHPAPIVPLGAEGSFDQDGQIPSCIRTINGVKYLYFTGIKNGGQTKFTNAIGLIRVEEEGYFKLREQVMFPADNEWFASHLNANGTYCSCKSWRNDEPVYDLHLAETEDGETWRTRGEFIGLEGREGGLCSFTEFEDKAVFCARDKDDYRGGSGSYRILTAEWGIEGWKRTGKLDIEKESWNNEMQCYPYFYRNYLFYNGNNFGKTGIGCVLCE